MEARVTDPRFSVSTFFCLLFALMLTSWFSFLLLTRLRVAWQETCFSPLVLEEETSKATGAGKSKVLLLLSVQAYGCFLMNGFLSALAPYSTLPYGNTTYHLATTLTVISGPTATLLVFLIHRSRSFEKPILPLVLVGSAAAAFLIFLAKRSPHPPMQATTIGSILAVCASVTCHACFSYVKACIAGCLRECSLGGRKGLFYFGVATQAGSLVGALVVFFLMNYADAFHAFHPC